MKKIQEIIENIHSRYMDLNAGSPATYIPELAKANPADFGISVMTVEGEVFSTGCAKKEFTLQSTSKPFIYGMALEEQGREFIRSRVGVEPTGEAFNSIVEMERKTNHPYNPMINSGAIAISSFIKGNNLSDKLQRVLGVFSAYAGRELRIDGDVFDSEKKTAHRNRAIAHLLRHFEVIDDRIDEALDLYFNQCSILASVEDLSVMAATLANRGVNPKTQKQVLKSDYVGDVLSLMFSCGMYDSSGEWAYTVGIPAKSGVSGAIFGVVPGELGVAVYSPSIDSKGHSIRGLKVFEDLSRECGLSIFRLTRGL